LPKLSKSDRFLFVGQNCSRNHAGEEASLVTTLLTSATTLDRDGAIAAEGAVEVRLLRFLMSPPEKLSAAETDDAAVVSDVFLARFGQLLADVTGL
jgi:hypothetical protein